MATTSPILDFLYAARFTLFSSFLVQSLWQEWISHRRLTRSIAPFFAKFPNLWMANAIASRKQNLVLYEVSQKYILLQTQIITLYKPWFGSLSQVNSYALVPRFSFTNDLDFVARMSSARTGYVKSDWYAGQNLGWTMTIYSPWKTRPIPSVEVNWPSESVNLSQIKTQTD